MDELSQYRQEIDNIDKQIIKLLAQRYELTKKVADYKYRNNLPSLQPERWQEVLNDKKTIWKELWLPEDYIQELWDIMHKYSLKYQDSNAEN